MDAPNAEIVQMLDAGGRAAYVIAGLFVGLIVYAIKRGFDYLVQGKGGGVVTCQQCAEHRATINKRIDEIGPAINRIFLKLAENDKRAEDRSEKLHRRLDPIIEKVAANSEAIENIKRLALSATTGGKK